MKNGLFWEHMTKIPAELPKIYSGSYTSTVKIADFAL
jgi:hypothetical protein